MARTVRDTNLQTRQARRGLAPRRKPYWRVIETGLHLGYRRNKEASGAWIARRFIGEGRYREAKLGIADDHDGDAADGVTLFSFKHAQDAARAWWQVEQRRDLGHAPDDGPYTVAKALEAYFAERERRGSKGLAKDRAAANVRILPELAEVEIGNLTTKRLRDWHAGLATAPKLARTSRMTMKRKTRAIDLSDADAVRARRSTANRTLTVLKAALNHAFHEARVASDDTWRKVKPFREADAAVIHFLSEDECRRLVNVCDGAFRDLVRAALLTGCRYGELTRMRASDFGAEAGTITVRESKAGKPRHVALTDEGRQLFATLTAGKAARDLIFIRDDGRPWAASHQQRPLEAASKHANLEPAASFHILRHTYASTLAMRGVPMGVIAVQLGHADTRMTERHYAHLAPNYVADTVRAALPVLGIVEKSSVTPLRRGFNETRGNGPASR